MSHALPYNAPRLSHASLLGIVVAHIMVFWLMLRAQTIPLPPLSAELTVSMLPAVSNIQPQPPKPEIVPPKPVATAKPATSRPPPIVQQQIATPTESPATTPIASPTPARPETTSPSVPTLASPAASSAARASQASVATSPRFDADYLDNPKPPYPPISRRMGEEGKVVVRVRVDAQGQTIDVQLHASSGSDRLDNAALTTVRRWKFVPARLGNDPITATVLVPIVFSLKD